MIPRSQECLSLAAPAALIQGSCGLFPGIPCPDSLPAPGGQDRGGTETWGLLLWRMLQDAAPSVQAWGSSPALSFLGLGVSWFFLQAGGLGASPQKGLVAF